MHIYSQGKETPMQFFKIVSPAFADSGTIPKVYSCEGRDMSPPLQWEGVPEGTKSFALTCVDPDAPAGDWIHWIVWNIPSAMQGLEAGINPEEQQFFSQGTNSWGRSGYGGPCPPRGHGLHRYFFTLYALRVEKINLPPSAQLIDLQQSMKRCELGTAEFMGRYERR